MLTAFLTLVAAAQVAQATPRAQQPDNDPVVCRRERSEVGTHMRPKPVCMKKSDWDLVEKHTQDQLQSLGERSRFDPGRAGAH
jgi:hypothetical protein